MASSYNSVTMIGNLVRDPEFKQAGNVPVCRFTIATNHKSKNRQTDTERDEVCYIDVTVLGNMAQSCHQYLKKGSKVHVSGRLKLEQWDDKATGQKRSKHSILADNVVFLSFTPEVTTQHAKTLHAPIPQNTDTLIRAASELPF